MLNPICSRCSIGDHATHRDGHCVVQFGVTGECCACADRSADVTASQKAIDHAAAPAIAGAATGPKTPPRDLLTTLALIENASAHLTLALASLTEKRDLYNTVADARNALLDVAGEIETRVNEATRGDR